jgi:ATP-binding cassette subfamily B protein
VDLYERAMASSRRILDLIQTRIAIRDRPGAKALATVRGAIEFRDVSFAYGDGGEVLHNVSLAVSAGETIAFVGQTGSGKSTVMKLLLRFYEPSAGEILLDGQPIHTLSLDTVRRRIGFVSQDVFLFQGTIRDNIAYGSADASNADVRAAAEAAEAMEFIAEMPGGFDTVVGERGQKLSGGQRQRLSIARALLKNPPVLILDEATSAVDNETEAAIQRSLQHISHTRTTLVIAHRLSTIVHATRIYVLDKGRIVEQGTHDELRARGGIYASLWAVQTGQIDSGARPAPHGVRRGETRAAAPVERWS